MIKFIFLYNEFLREGVTEKSRSKRWLKLWHEELQVKTDFLFFGNGCGEGKSKKARPNYFLDDKLQFV